MTGRLSRTWRTTIGGFSLTAISHLRMRFQATHRAVVEVREFDADSIIFLARDLPEPDQLVAEIAQPTYPIYMMGKIVIDKTPPGARSRIALNPASMAALLHMWAKLAR